ncbi:hypothetical protein HANVADRAFT_53385 [Hanseniaspora valbyensis NRRL Y-1626]|uniref:Uncharacterized protein n=1 Tax=Hanseniaspora valbyensis NRRL Y-1626 TaxID=766949 RepID=A0A1B7TBS6_9ASCO|nr:hypothetical protein HANVADRAFT_53385 [Hanseniaspora valbyensis NRRL Y-1626]
MAHFLYKERAKLLIQLFSLTVPWPSWLRRATVNRKIGGSTPPGTGYNYFYFFC